MFHFSLYVQLKFNLSMSMWNDDCGLGCGRWIHVELVDVHVECCIVVEMWIHVEMVVELVDYHCNLHVHDWNVHENEKKQKKTGQFFLSLPCAKGRHTAKRVIYPVLNMDFAVCKGRHTAKLPYVCRVPTAAHSEVFFNFSNFTVCSVLGLGRRGNGAV